MKQSAGLLLYRRQKDGIEVLLAHPGGPYWAKKDAGAWSIPKGEFVGDEEPLAAAKREFAEELGTEAPEGELIELGNAKQASGKVVYAWAVESDFDVSIVRSNEVEIEWPPRSGQKQLFPEVDRAKWFRLDVVSQKLVKGQIPLVERLAEHLGVSLEPPEPEQTQASLF